MSAVTLWLLFVITGAGNTSSTAMTTFPTEQQCNVAKARLVKATEAFWWSYVTKDHALCIEVPDHE